MDGKQLVFPGRFYNFQFPFNCFAKSGADGKSFVCVGVFLSYTWVVEAWQKERAEAARREEERLREVEEEERKKVRR